MCFFPTLEQFYGAIEFFKPELMSFIGKIKSRELVLFIIFHDLMIPHFSNSFIYVKRHRIMLPVTKRATQYIYACFFCAYIMVVSLKFLIPFGPDLSLNFISAFPIFCYRRFHGAAPFDLQRIA